MSKLAALHRDRVETALRERRKGREPQWTESIAVGSRSFVDRLQRELGDRGRHREIEQAGEDFVLREPAAAYGLNSAGGSASLRTGIRLIRPLPSCSFEDLRRCDPAESRPHPLELAPPVCVTQQDIRELQLAKAAIAAGVSLLRERFRGAAAVDPRLYLAGAFGNYVSRTSARRIGLIDAPEASIEPAGNTALLGAKMALFTAPEDRDFRSIRARVEHVPLASVPTFQDTFIAATAFPS